MIMGNPKVLRAVSMAVAIITILSMVLWLVLPFFTA